MNFYKALQHAFIGYGIQRTGWDKEKVPPLYWDSEVDALRWLDTKEHYSPDYDNTICDFNATDWETV